MEETEFNLKDVVAILRRQIRLIVLVMVVGVGGALVYLFSVAPVYTASTLILVDPGQKNILDLSQPVTLQASMANARVESEVEILKSDATALAVVRNEDLVADPEFGIVSGPASVPAAEIGAAAGVDMEDPGAIGGPVLSVLENFKTATTIRRKGLTYLISASVSAKSPERAARLANALVANYIEQQVAAKVAFSLAARDILLEQVDASRAAVAASEEALDRIIKANIARLEDENAGAGLADLQRLLQQAGDNQNQIRDTIFRNELSSVVLASIYSVQQEAAIARRQYQTLLSRLREVEAQATVQIADSRVVSAALPPVNQSFPKPKLVLIAAFVLSLGLGIGLAFLNDFYRGGFGAGG